MLIALMFALPMEARPFLKRFGTVRSLMTPVGLQLGEVDVLTAISGYGRECSAACAAQLFTASPDALLIAGFAGALDANLGTGDLVIAESAIEPSGSSPAADHTPSPRLRDVAEQVAGSRKLRYVTGRLLTAPEPLRSPVEKAEKADLYRCCAVDMESAPAAALAEKAGTPFLIVRCIADRLCDTVPEPIAAAMNRDGAVSLRRLFVALISHPGQIRDLLRLRAQSQTASRTLTEFLTAFLDRLGQSVT